MEKTLQELADLLQGSIIQGDPSLKLTGVNGLEEAGPTEISFAVPPYLELAGKSRAGAIMIPEEGELRTPGPDPCKESTGGFCQTADALPSA